jgi:hypothetical protein
LKTFPKRQNPLDWATQYWNIILGQKATLENDSWLLGPTGKISESANQFIQRIAQEEGLQITRNIPSSGLIEDINDWGTAVNPKIKDFYKRTSDFDLFVTTAWKPGFGSLGYLIAKLFSQRIQQLNLPQKSNCEIAFKSDFIKLIDSNGRAQYTIWHRSVRDTAEVVFFGIYTTCRIPSGDLCIKVIFPLPCGSATVIFRPQSDLKGNLLLVSSGNQAGDPGFYFLVLDRKGFVWKNYLPSFRESLLVSESYDGKLTAEHQVSLWFFKVYKMIYSMVDKTAGITN